MRNRLLRPELAREDRESILKDFHLIEAALTTDKIVVSRDDRARSLFNVPELNTVVWVNPVTNHPDCLTWLAEGAQSTQRWLLGSGC